LSHRMLAVRMVRGFSLGSPAFGCVHLQPVPHAPVAPDAVVLKYDSPAAWVCNGSSDWGGNVRVRRELVRKDGSARLKRRRSCQRHVKLPGWEFHTPLKPGQAGDYAPDPADLGPVGRQSVGAPPGTGRASTRKISPVGGECRLVIGLGGCGRVVEVVEFGADLVGVGVVEFVEDG
jgi:hypothetical protein